jgi:hypothetical protein
VNRALAGNRDHQTLLFFIRHFFLEEYSFIRNVSPRRRLRTGAAGVLKRTTELARGLRLRHWPGTADASP